jgi:hypothetical protein
VNDFTKTRKRKMKTNTNESQYNGVDRQKKEPKMKTRNHYFASVVVITLFVAGTCFAMAYDGITSYVHVESPNDVEKKTVCVGSLCCDTATNSFLAGSVQCGGKTGWDMIVEQVQNISLRP